jgi:hypothetical protein
MDQFDRHRNTENDYFETAEESGMGEVKGSIEVSESPLDNAVEAGSEPASAHKAPRRFPRGTEQMAVATVAPESAEDEDEDYDDEDDDEEQLVDGVPAVSRKVRRRRRRTRPRSKTIAMKRLTREELRIGALLYPPVDVPRPQTRSECHQQHRPCPWVACKHHLYLDVNPETGSIKINFPDLEPWELQDTCALDVAERGGITLEEVGEIMNLTRERIRQVEVRGLRKIRACSPTPEDLGALAMEDDE